MFMDVEKFSSEIDHVSEIYDKLISAFHDYYETYIFPGYPCNLRFNVSFQSGEKEWIFHVDLKSESISSILDFFDGFNYFLSNNFLYEDLCSLQFKLYSLKNNGSGFADSCSARFFAEVSYSNEQSGEGGEV